MDLTELLKFVTKKEASDLHLKPGRPPLLRINGRLVPLKTDPLQPKEIEEMVLPILSPMQREKLMVHYAVDIGYGVTGVARFRGNIFLQRGSWTAVFRRIPFQIPTMAELNLPDVIATFIDLPAGLVLVTGPTGSGKSTTLASIIKAITERHPIHIVTVEDPIEYLFQDNLASVCQRELGTDTTGFQEAIKNAMRQDPDVIMVGEMRDWETMATAITAAETGHLVFSTLHTNNAAQTIDRIMDSCPSGQANQIRRQMALVLRAIVSMQLIERTDGHGRIPVIEILVNSPKIAKLIETNETKDILEEMESSVTYYRMQSMNQSLIALLANGAVGLEKALELTQDPEDLSLKLRKLFPSIEEKYRGGIMSPSANDFTAITELMDTKKLYEEQEEKWKLRLQEKDDLIAGLESDLRQREAAIEQRAQAGSQAEEESSKLRAEIDRLKGEAAQRIQQLNERIRDLNQRLTGGAAGTPPPQSGFFKR